MAKEKTFLFRVKSLLVSPKSEYKKIMPYIRTRFANYKRSVLEMLGNEKMSKPYPGHDTLLKFVNFENGFFIEVGGNDGYFQDPTYYLEKFRGWKGIIIEPLPIFVYCKKNRSHSTVINSAAVSEEFNGGEISIIDCNAMSVVKGSFDGYEEWIRDGEKVQGIAAKERRVSATTLNKILSAQHDFDGKIDLLVIDTEGYELEVLKGLDLKKFAPRFILVEIHAVDHKSKIESYIGQEYKLLEVIGNDDHLYGRIN